MGARGGGGGLGGGDSCLPRRLSSPTRRLGGRDRRLPAPDLTMGGLGCRDCGIPVKNSPFQGYGRFYGHPTLLKRYCLCTMQETFETPVTFFTLMKLNDNT
jgi:hypothetical protein